MLAALAALAPLLWVATPDNAWHPAPTPGVCLPKEAGLRHGRASKSRGIMGRASAKIKRRGRFPTARVAPEGVAMKKNAGKLTRRGLLRAGAGLALGGAL